MKQSLKLFLFSCFLISSVRTQASHHVSTSETTTSNIGICNSCTSSTSKRSCCDCKVGVPCAAPQKFEANRACDIQCSTGRYNCGRTTYIPRSQGDNTAREMVGWNFFIHQYFPPENYVSASLTAEYTRSFRGCKIADALFCTDCLTFSGSQVPGRRQGSDVLADNFGLSPDFRGTIKIRPRIENEIIDINVFLGLEEWFRGLFIRVHLPIVHTHWDLGLDECSPCNNLYADRNALPLNAGNFPSCYVTTSSEPAVDAPNIRQAISGDFLFGDMQTPWKFGRFDFCSRDKIRAADVDIMVGFNYWDSTWFHNALGAKLVIPTGNRPKAKYVFEPLVGDGKHWQAGAYFSSHLVLLGDPCHTYHTISLHFEGNITYVFETHQKRSFDFLHNGLLSRYSLLKEFEADNVTYANNLINAINFATRDAIVSVGAQGDASLMLAYRSDSWVVDIGYNIFGRQAECICIETKCPCDIDRRKFGFKGTEGVCATIYNVTADDTFGTVVITTPLNSTQSNVTMFSAGTVDNPVAVPVEAGTIAVTALSRQTANTPVTGSDVILAQTSQPPHILSCHDLDPNSAAQPSMLTHKLFAHIQYIWFDSSWSPHIGIGGEIELDGKRPRNQGLNQWGIWIKGGLSY